MGMKVKDTYLQQTGEVNKEVDFRFQVMHITMVCDFSKRSRLMVEHQRHRQDLVLRGGARNEAPKLRRRRGSIA